MPDLPLAKQYVTLSGFWICSLKHYNYVIPLGLMRVDYYEFKNHCIPSGLRIPIRENPEGLTLL